MTRSDKGTSLIKRSNLVAGCVSVAQRLVGVRGRCGEEIQRKRKERERAVRARNRYPVGLCGRRIRREKIKKVLVIWKDAG